MPASAPKQKLRRVAVLGAGPAGLSAAYTLARRDKSLRVDVYEASRHFGGVITTESCHDFRYELGPSSMNAKHPAVAHLIFERLQLTPRLQKRDAAAKNFFIFKKGQILATPRSPIQFCLTKLLSTRAKLRVLAEPFVSRITAREANKETVADFFQRRFGPEFLEYVVDPAVAGIYSATPTSLSMKHALGKVWTVERKKGSVIAGFLTGGSKTQPDPRYDAYTRKELLEGFSFDRGMQVLTDTLVARTKATNTRNTFYKWSKVRTLERDSDGAWRVNGRGKYDAVVSTIPTHALGSVYTNVSLVQRMFRKLAKGIQYAPVSIAVLGFHKEQIPTRLDGFGALIPSCEGRKILGVNYSSSNFPDRLEDPNKVYLTVYVGGGRSPKLARRRGRDIVNTATKELQDILGVKGDPVFTRVKSWTLGIPQYTTGYDEMLCSMARIEKSVPGLFLAGNYRGGVGVPDAILSGVKSAERVATFLKRGS